MSKEKIEFAEFLEIEKKLEITIGKITAVELIPKSKKLLKLTVDFRYDDGDTRTVVTNLGDKIESPSVLLGVKCPFITNLAPVTMMGVTSTAMIMVGEMYVGGMEFEKYNVGTKLL